MADTQTNLAVFYARQGNHAKAQAAYETVLRIYEQLATDNLAAYLPKVARTGKEGIVEKRQYFPTPYELDLHEPFQRIFDEFLFIRSFSF